MMEDPGKNKAQAPVHAEIGGKQLETADYGAWLFGAIGEMKKALSDEMKKGKRPEDVAREIISKVVVDARSLDIRPRDDEVVKAEKERVQRYVDGFRKYCNIKDTVSMIIYNYNLSEKIKKEAEEKAEAERKTSVEKSQPDSQIRRASNFDILSQSEAIAFLADKYLETLEKKWKKYDEAPITDENDTEEKIEERRIAKLNGKDVPFEDASTRKNRYLREFAETRDSYVPQIKKDIELIAKDKSNVDEEEYVLMDNARKKLENALKIIEPMHDDITAFLDSEKVNRMVINNQSEEEYPTLEPVDDEDFLEEAEILPEKRVA